MNACETGVVTATVRPYESQMVAIVRAFDTEWSTKCSVRVVKRAPKEDAQVRLIGAERVEELTRQIARAIGVWKETSQSYASLDEMLEKVRETGEQFVDTEFLPVKSSVDGEQDEEVMADRVIDWRRPHEFSVDADHDEPVLFARPELRDPSLDIAQGQLPDTWLFSTISTVAEVPSLIERIFVNQEYNYEGAYKIKLCLGGEWEEIIIDDLIPCYP
jgi:hypothetical protein